MRSAMHRHRQDERGAATVEFALLTLILVPTMLYAIYFYEVCFAKIKANEAARYMVWEMTVYGLSDWKNHNHDNKFNSARSALLNEVQQRYGDDLDGATGPSPLITGHIAHKPMTVDVVFESNQATLANVDPEIFTVGTFTGLNGIASELFGFFKFNQKGKVTGSLKVTAKNKWLGKTMPVFYTQSMLMNQDLNLSVSQSIIADQWDLKEGRAVNAMRNRGNECTSSDYCSQVDTIAFFRINDLLGPVSNGASSLLSAVGVHWPFDTIVRSKPLDGTNKADSSICLSVNNATCHSHRAVKKAYTNTFKDTHDREDSDYYKVYQKTGQYYMGCDEELKQDGECNYSSKTRQLGTCP